jgi:XTP/dITP diphosphohydrolase
LIPRLVLATKNRDKLREMEAVLADTGLVGEVVQGRDWPDVEETGDTLEANALHKARVAVEATGLPAIADDTGLEVSALGGGPGVHTARLAGPKATYEQNVALLLDLLTGVSDRSARFRSVVALVFPDGSEIRAEGVLFGAITPEPRGSGGFGYDPVFLVGDQTLAEMGEDCKNLMSHRAIALRALARELGLPAP